MNPWESNALEYYYNDNEAARPPQDDTLVGDPIIYPGIYAPSGFDMINIL
ncbi:hypothetical protein EKO27_g10975, partial [Xylaria grammica]